MNAIGRLLERTPGQDLVFQSADQVLNQLLFDVTALVDGHAFSGFRHVFQQKQIELVNAGFVAEVHDRAGEQLYAQALYVQKQARAEIIDGDCTGWMYLVILKNRLVGVVEPVGYLGDDEGQAV